MNTERNAMSTTQPSALQRARYVFGPVPSRRLGRSLGVDIIPKKTCTLDCVYCELGATDRRALRRMEYVPTEAVLEELRQALTDIPNIDVITFSGSGEPTLHSGLGRMIRAVKEMTVIPVAVLTNGTLMFLEEVRNDLLGADIVLPSLDAATEPVFRRINRPHPRLQLKRILDGLVEFRRIYKGHIWLEILLAKEFNDTPEELQALKNAAHRIKPDRLQLNTVVRPPAVAGVEPLDHDALAAIRMFFGPPCDIVEAAEEKVHPTTGQPDKERIVALLCRRPMTLVQLGLAMDSPEAAVQEAVSLLLRRGRIRRFEFHEEEYFEATETART